MCMINKALFIGAYGSSLAQVIHWQKKPIFLTVYPPKAIWQIIFAVYSFVARCDIPKITWFLYPVGGRQWLQREEAMVAVNFSGDCWVSHRKTIFNEKEIKSITIHRQILTDLCHEEDFTGFIIRLHIQTTAPVPVNQATKQPKQNSSSHTPSQFQSLGSKIWDFCPQK